ncbi:hypothetical protein E4T56_gene16687, partial [Termitomyces sp. T112]
TLTPLPVPAVYVGSFFAMLNARQRTENGSSRHDLESSRGTQLRVHLHTVSYTTATPSSPPSAVSNDQSESELKTYPWSE